MLPSMDLRRSLSRGIRRGWRSFLREGRWSTTFFSVFSATLLLQVLFLFGLGVWSAENVLLAKSDVRIEVMPGARDTDIQAFYAALRVQPFVQSATYVPREKAFEQEAGRDPGLPEFLKKYQMQNPFPDTFSVTLLSFASYDALRVFASQSQWKSVVHPSFLTMSSRDEQQVQGLLRVARTVELLTGVLLALAGGGLLLLIIELVRRRARRRAGELRLETLLGASNVDIIVPFATEILVCLFAGLVLASLCTLLLPSVLEVLAPQTYGHAAFLTLRSELHRLLWSLGPLVLVLEVLTAPLVALGGIVLGVRPDLTERL